jgi:hypothetical protein
MENSSINLNLLQHSWTAEIKDRGGHTHIIWHTSCQWKDVLWQKYYGLQAIIQNSKKERETNPFIIREYD